jgi:hypothetical protein
MMSPGSGRVYLIWKDGDTGYLADTLMNQYTISFHTPPPLRFRDGSRLGGWSTGGYSEQEIKYDGYVTYMETFDPKTTITLPPLDMYNNVRADYTTTNADVIEMLAKSAIIPSISMQQPEPIAGYWVNPQQRKRVGRTQ